MKPHLHYAKTAPGVYDAAVATINAWNRLSIAGRLVPGAYQPGKPAS